MSSVNPGDQIMVRATYQKRLSALILGIRPSVGHLYGSTERTPADNLTMLGVQAWQVGLRQLASDLSAAPELAGSELWIQQWVATEIDREHSRWSDASTMLELLALALGPASADPSEEPRGRMFWAQWQNNVNHFVTLTGSGAAAAASDTAELLSHCIDLVQQHAGPETIVNALTEASLAIGPMNGRPAPFRPLTSAIERLQLSALLAAAYDDEPACTAAMAKLLEQRPPSPPCKSEAGSRRRLRGWRYGATVGH
jgi:hypothetical protein